MMNQNTATMNQDLKWRLETALAMGGKTTYLRLPVDLLTFDERYQRTGRDVSNLVKNWDEVKLDPLVCVPHYDEGKLYVVDGYGRYTASQIVDSKEYSSLFCKVILNAPTDPVERSKFEAEKFLHQTDQTARLTPLQKHGARVLLGDKAAMLLDEMKEKYSFEYATKNGQQKAGILGNYKCAYSIAKAYGRECFEYIMYTLRRGGFDRKVNGYAANILDAVKDMWRLYPNERKTSWKILGDFLRDKDVLHLRSFAVHKYPMLSQPVAISMYLEDILVEKMSVSHARVIKDGKVIAA